MRKREIEHCLSNMGMGNYKFLYVSPERFGNKELFQERGKENEIN